MLAAIAVIIFLCLIRYIVNALALLGAFALGFICAVAWMLRLLFVQSYHAYRTISRWVKHAH